MQSSGPGLPPFSTAVTPVMRDACLHLETELAQVIRDELGRCGPRDCSSSGLLWMSRRQAITFGSTALTADSSCEARQPRERQGHGGSEHPGHDSSVHSIPLVAHSSVNRCSPNSGVA